MATNKPTSSSEKNIVWGVFICCSRHFVCAFLTCKNCLTLLGLCPATRSPGREGPTSLTRSLERSDSCGSRVFGLGSENFENLRALDMTYPVRTVTRKPCLSCGIAAGA